jgi:hypothetical protein
VLLQAARVTHEEFQADGTGDSPEERVFAAHVSGQ